MRPEDDPEQRIRELEQPLADVARATELGTSEQTSATWGAYPPPPAPNPYQPNYSGYPVPNYSAKPSGGLRLGWMLFAVSAVGLAVAGGLIVFNSHSPSPVSPKKPSSAPAISGGGGTFTSGYPAPEPPQTAEAPENPGAPPLTGAAISVSGVGEAKTVICDESKVSISGVDNMVTITGHCAHVEVSGVENNVSIQSATSISASGMNNQITYSTGDPEIDKSGFDNSIERR
jgi:hypothetical protein